MRPLKRQPVSKAKSVRKFRNDSRRTRAANMIQPMRGGWRL